MADLLISGVVSGDLPGGLPKVIELTALNDIPDLSLYWIGSANDGLGSDGQEFQLSGSATAGQKIYISNTASDEFVSFFGFVPTLITPPFNSATILTGDDAIELFVDTGEVDLDSNPIFTAVDTFGNVDGDASVQGWEYPRGWAYRKAGTGVELDGSFNIGNWEFGANALTGVENNSEATNPVPIPTVYIRETDDSTDISDAGITDTYEVFLSTQPTDPVVVTVIPDPQTDLGNGPGEPILLTFTAANYNQPQSVTVEAVDDQDPTNNGERTITHTVNSADSAYDVSSNTGNLVVNISQPSDSTTSVDTVVSQDVTNPGVTITESSGETVVSEGGGIVDTYEIFLNTKPTSDVEITLINDVAQTQLDVTTLTFTPDNFFEPQTVTVTALADSTGGDQENSVISHTATSGDPSYDTDTGTLTIPDVTTTILDRGITITEVTTDVVTESGMTTYNVVLNTAPTGEVEVTVAPNDSQTDVGAGPGLSTTLLFSPSVLSLPVNVTVVDDGVGEAEHTGSISHFISMTEDVSFGPTLNIDSVTLNINEPGISIVESDGGTTVSEAGVSDQYDIVLNSIPSQPVTVTVTPDNQTDLGDGPGIPLQLIFDPMDPNFSQSQTINVTAVDVGDGTRPASITHSAESNDPNYNDTNLPDVTPTIIDCFLTGTQLLTDKGERRVEDLKIGDRLQTLDGSLEQIKWVGIQTCYTQGHNHPLRTYPIRVKAGALGPNCPIRDLYVSPDHALLVEGILVNAGALENGDSIVQIQPTEEKFVYYHIELERHNLLIADGAPAESYLPQKQDRNTFDNGDEYTEMYPYSNMQALVPMKYPRVSSKRQLPRFIAKYLAHQNVVQNV